MKKSTGIMALGALLCFAFATAGSPAFAARKRANRVSIAQQFGLGYAPIMVLEKQGLVEKYMKGAEVKWVQLGSGGAIREAMASGQVDVGSMGTPPFLIAWAKDLDVKVISSLCEMPLGMQTYHPDMKTLRDVRPGMKIALPSPGSIQHILLSMAAENQLGDPKALDDQLVAMPHPDAATALINKIEIDAHFTSPPYIFTELEQPDIHQVVDGEKDSFGGPYTFLVCVATKRFHDENPEMFDAVYRALEEAIDWLEENPEDAAEMLAADFKLSKEDVLKQLEWPGVKFEKNPRGMLKFLDFMERSGYVQKSTNDVADLIWETLDPSMAD